MTTPPTLGAEARRVAKERHIAVSHTLVSLAEPSIPPERGAKAAALKEAHQKLIGEQDPRP